MAQVASRNCDICEKKPRKEYCLDCEQYFCETCKTLHLKSKISNDHSFQKGENFKGVSKAKCNDHKLNFIFVCIHCDVPVCKSCITESHNGHKLSDIQDTISSLRESIVSDIETKTDKYRDYLQELKKNISSSEKEANDAMIAAREDGRIIKDMVDAYVDEITASIKDKNKKEVEKLKALSTKVQESLDVMNLIRSKYDSLQEIGHNPNLLAQLKQLLVENKEKETLTFTVNILSAEYKSRNCNLNDVKQLLGQLETREQIVIGPGRIQEEEEVRRLIKQRKEQERERRLRTLFIDQDRLTKLREELDRIKNN